MGHGHPHRHVSEQRNSGSDGDIVRLSSRLEHRRAGARSAAAAFVAVQYRLATGALIQPGLAANDDELRAGAQRKRETRKKKKKKRKTANPGSVAEAFHARP